MNDPYLIDPSRGRVVVFSRLGNLPATVKDCLRADTPVDTHKRSEFDNSMHADYLIASTLSATVERDAARIGALPVVLPQARDWLAGRIDEHTKRGEPVVIVMWIRP